MNKITSRSNRLQSTFIFLLIIGALTNLVKGQVETPSAMIPGLKVSLFSAEPDIVTPTGIAVDKNGRVFCIESHTHFRPKDYKGPEKDRIRIYEDTNNDGRADKVTTFFEGTTATMNMAFAPDGSLYVATRAKIFRLRDSNGDDQADKNDLIVDLQTEGNYPHNGLSGITFDSNGNFFFGFGENLGVDYKLVGTDGITLSGGGEGGNIYSCRVDGSGLRRIATGFWNPFGLTLDRRGHLFAIDNDPDWRPPCRLLHIVDGGDYGYRFSHGRRGTHPFTAWFGEVPGTLGLVSGTGEAPSGILNYDSLSKNGESVLLSTSWGLHSIEKFALRESGASFVSSAETILKGGKDFRPVALAVAPDGTIYVSDWCKRSYELHGFGRIWKLEFESGKKINASKPKRSDYPYDSTDAAERQTAALKINRKKIDFPKAIQAAISQLEKATLIRRSKGDQSVNYRLLISFLSDEDPFIRQAARFALSTQKFGKTLVELKLPDDQGQRLGLALLMREFSDSVNTKKRIPELLGDEDPEVRFVAIKWIGEKRLSEFRNQLETEVKTRPLTGRLFESYLAALDLIDKNRNGAEFEKAEANILAEILSQKDSPVDTLVVALRKLQSVNLRDQFKNDHPKLNPQLLESLLNHPSKKVVREVIQTIRELGTEQSQTLLLKICDQPNQYKDLVQDALIGLDPGNEKSRRKLFQTAISNSKNHSVAVQRLTGVELSNSEKSITKTLNDESVSKRFDTKPNLSNRSLDELVRDVSSRLNSANAASGRLIFFNDRFGQCSKCHQMDGRGGNIGPDLSNLSNTNLFRMIESIVEPSKEIAPRHTPWLIETYEGKTFSGVLVAERGEQQSYADANGKIIQVKFDEIERKKPQTKSIMPEKLLDAMSIDEIADLIKFLKRD